MTEIKKSLIKHNSEKGIETIPIMGKTNNCEGNKFQNSQKKKKITIIRRRKHRDGSTSLIST